MTAALLIACLAGGAAAPDDPSAEAKSRMWEVLGQFDSFPGAEPYPVADSMEARGATFRSAGFATSASAEAVVAFYRRAFERQGLLVFEQPAEMTQFLGLSAFDHKSDIERTVVVFPGNGGATRVILSLSSGHELDQVAQKPEVDQTGGLPVPANARAMRSDSKDGQRRTTSVSFKAVMESSAFLPWAQGQLQMQGWVGESRSDEPAGQTLRFRRGSEALELELVALPGAVSVTYLMLH